jgi:hypothetical protein
MSQNKHRVTITQPVWRSSAAGYETHTFHVTVDLGDVVASMGPKAIRNKSKQAKEIAGAVCVQFVPQPLSAPSA